ncbi:asparagine synthase (glutamine-hydrolyzing) [Micromonospora sp. C51]|uniref:asparagine synthase (glutamine-hydrolyzing) n=1 Tax=Micromonospora sp. C51 TaxID=2824879 RepID=UPI001B35D207|nr:asparagine synthase (glutamine-hydrolyzing) [Micromonospora sp. C51]MBQ1050201.1 asparagine synthase (glutamine-hydrolyzing) [Micromonospora sp. C51]
MCGLAGIARLGGQDLSSETDILLDRFADILHHRGPDESEVLRQGPVGLAFTRLSLVDPEDGSQPLVSDDGNLILIANGEIYNHKELAATLPSDVRLRTGSDCEVLLYLYRRHGLNFLRNVRGMFAIVLWDRSRRQLVLARDRFGIKPLYYHQNDDRVLVSSEIKALFADPATPRRFDWVRALTVPSLSAAPRFISTPEPCTWFEGVKSVPAATIQTIDLQDGVSTHHRYWELPTESVESGDARYFTERYAELLEASVRDCATADTELGVFLSGGVDSAAVLALARDQLGEVHTFTALSGGTRENGDAEYSARLARELGVHNHQVVFGPDHVPTADEWARLVWLAETPMTGPEIYYKHELHRFARQERPELRGMLLGAASDEFNGGYSGEMGTDWVSFLDSLEGMSRNTWHDQEPLLRHWWKPGGSFINSRALRELLGSSHDPYAEYLTSEYHKIQQYNVWHEDRTAAGSGVEARVPFLDHRLVELVTAVPRDLRPDLLWNKRILRDAVRGRVPSWVAEREKVPFFYGPGTRHAYRMLVRLMHRDGRQLVERAVSAPGAETFLDIDAISSMLSGLRDGDTDSASVEILMRVVNMGLLADMVAQPPALSDMSAGSVRTALPHGVHPVAGTEELFTLRASRHTPDQVPVRSPSLLVLSDPEGTCYLANEGQIEFELEPQAPILRVVNCIDGKASLAKVLSEAGVALADVSDDLNTLLEQHLISFGG